YRRENLNTERPWVRTHVRRGPLSSLNVGSSQLLSSPQQRFSRDTGHSCANCRHWPKTNYESVKKNLSRVRCAISVKPNARTKTANRKRTAVEAIWVQINSYLNRHESF